MKNILKETAAAMFLGSLLSCQQIQEDSTKPRPMVRIEINATTLLKSDIGDWNDGGSGDITTNGTPVSSRSADEAVKRMAFVLINEDGEKTIAQEKSSEDDDYMTLTAEVPEGEYTLIAFGHNGTSSATISASKTITPEGKLTDSFLYYKEMELTNSSSGSKSITLDRCIAKFSMKHTDEIPDGVASIVFHISGGGRVLDASTGFATETAAQTVTVNLPESGVPKKDNTFSAFTFLPSEEAELDITVSAKDKDGEAIATYEFEDVDMEVNMQTIYTGAFFKRSKSFSASVNRDWKDSNEVSF